ncbi:hypothetical protein M9Y10_011463 [Tritrichomonas musculus]|uniref:Amino acid transporter transmembrane domain-containing protein n=1 Tax=Tritrichomonas musculus TaxID=1915356 RepID=A0ABR2IKU3_9EUKA
MFLINKSRFTEKDIQVVETHANSLNMFEFGIFIFNFISGIGILKVGYSYQCGIIPNIIISAIFMLISLYSLFLYIKCACYAHQDTIDDIWKATISKKTALIPLIISVIVCQTAIARYFRIIVIVTNECIDFLFPNTSSFSKDHYFILLLVLIIYCLPISGTRSLKFFIILSYLDFFTLILLIIYVIYSFSNSIIDYGFDPDHKLSVGQLNSKIIENIAIFMTSYITMPLNYPSLGNLSYPTQRRLFRAFFIGFFLSFIFYNIFGIFTYMTFFNNPPQSASLTKSDSINFGGQICLIFAILYTMPCYLNQFRYIFVNIYSRNEFLHFEIWIMTGIIIFILGVILSGFSEPFSVIITFLHEFSSELIMFFIVPLMYLAAFRKKNMLHFIGSLFLFLICLVSIIFAIIINFFHKVVE